MGALRPEKRHRRNEECLRTSRLCRGCCRIEATASSNATGAQRNRQGLPPGAEGDRPILGLNDLLAAIALLAKKRKRPSRMSILSSVKDLSLRQRGSLMKVPRES